MAHHGEARGPLPETLRKLLELGATNDFPQGKLSDDDEGGLKIAVGTQDGKVVIDFGKPTAWIGFDAQQAIRIGEILIARGRAVLAERGDPEP